MDVIITDHTARVIAEKDRAVQAALEMIGQIAEGYAKVRVTQLVYAQPQRGSYVRTGRLRNSITHRMKGKNAVIIGAGANYARYIELGTRKMKARPFIRPAAQDHMQEYKRIIEAALSR